MVRKVWRMVVLTVTVVFIMAVASGCSDKGTKEAVQPNVEAFTYIRYELPEKIFMGSNTAPNTIYFVFDYTCSWCMKWNEEVFPKLKETYIDSGKAKYMAQPIPLLSRDSLAASEVDYLLEKQYAERYYELQKILEADAIPHGSTNTTGWATDAYYEQALGALGITYAELKKEPVPDRLTLMRKFTKSLGVQAVPTLYVNGIKVSSAFSLEEIEGIIDGRIKEGDTIKLAN